MAVDLPCRNVTRRNFQLYFQTRAQTNQSYWALFSCFVRLCVNVSSRCSVTAVLQVRWGEATMQPCFISIWSQPGAIFRTSYGTKSCTLSFLLGPENRKIRSHLTKDCTCVRVFSVISANYISCVRNQSYRWVRNPLNRVACQARLSFIRASHSFSARQL